MMNITNLIYFEIFDFFLIHTDIYVYIYIYTGGYHTITDVYTTALLLTKPSSDDDSEFRHDIYIYINIYIYGGVSLCV